MVISALAINSVAEAPIIAKRFDLSGIVVLQRVSVRSMPRDQGKAGSWLPSVCTLGAQLPVQPGCTNGTSVPCQTDYKMPSEAGGQFSHARMLGEDKAKCQ